MKVQFNQGNVKEVIVFFEKLGYNWIDIVKAHGPISSGYFNLKLSDGSEIKLEYGDWIVYVEDLKVFEKISNIAESRIDWRVSAIVECPHCGYDNDYMNVDEWYVNCQIAQNVEKFDDPIKLECYECGREIKIVGSDY